MRTGEMGEGWGRLQLFLGIFTKVALKQRLDGTEEVDHYISGGRVFQAEGTANAKAKECLASLRAKTSVARAQ